MKYNEIYPTSLSNGDGLFYKLSLLPNIPWNILPEDVKKSLDRAYAIRSGCKNVYSSFYNLDITIQVSSLAAVYVDKWTRFWNLYTLDYNPLDAYIVKEESRRNKDVDTSRITTYGKSEQTVVDDTGTITDSSEGTNNSNNFVFGFNSTSEVPTDKSDDSESNTNTETRDLTTTTNNSNSGSDSVTGTDVEVENYDVTKKGNIGYSTPQQLLSEEFELWSKIFFENVFRDIDKFIMIKIYT